MSADSQSIRERQVEEFVRNLSGLDDGERARFKRNAGKTIAESRNAQLLFYRRVLPRGVSTWQEERYFLLATLYPLDRRQRERDRQAVRRVDEAAEPPITGGKSLGQSFRGARTARNESGLDRRFARLLDAGIDDISFQLRQAIMRLSADHAPINWAQLTRDILAWDHPSRYVQRNWARDYVAPDSQEQEPQPNSIS